MWSVVLLCLLFPYPACIRYKVRPAWLVGGDIGRKFALRGQNAPNWAILGEQGEFCTGSGPAWFLLGEFCPAHAVRRSVLGEFCTGSGPAWFLLGEFCPAHAVRRSVLGEFCTGSGPARFLLGEFCPAVAPSVCPGAELPPPTGTAAIPAGAVAEPTKLLWRSSHRLRWGFCSIRSWLAACRRRVVALMTPFPPFGDGSARPPPFAPAAPGVRARSASLARPRPCVLRPERIGLISRNLVLHSRVASAKIVVSTPTWRVIRPPVR